VVCTTGCSAVRGHGRPSVGPTAHLVVSNQVVRPPGMGSKPSVAAAARGAAPVDKQPPRSDRLGRHPDDASHHHDHADGHSPLRHAKHAPPELQALFKHLCFQTSIRRGSDRVVNLQEVLMEELGIAKPDRKQLGEVVDMVCENPDSITEEELERICAALPDAAARLAADGSPLAALIKDVPLHLAMARAVEQVLQAKPHEAESSWLPDIHETLHPRSVGHWRGEIEVRSPLAPKCQHRPSRANSCPALDPPAPPALPPPARSAHPDQRRTIASRIEARKGMLHATTHLFLT
jgi:hypothetical protein